MSHAFTLELCNLIGLQIFCSRHKPDIAVVPNPTFASRVGPRPTKATQALPFPKSWLCAYATVPGIEMRILEPTKIYAEGFGAK